jgi:hypothetical protein
VSKFTYGLMTFLFFQCALRGLFALIRLGMQKYPCMMKREPHDDVIAVLVAIVMATAIGWALWS